MKKIKLAVVGCLGRMGKEIIKEINISPNCELVSVIEVKKTTIKRISKIEISYDKKIAFSKADIIIDFSTPKSSLESVFYALKLKKKLIIGTTGLNNSQIKNSSDLRNIISDKYPDKKITLSIIRNNSEKKIKVQLGERPDNKSLISDCILKAADCIFLNFVLPESDSLSNSLSSKISVNI